MCHLESLNLADVERLQDLVEDGDFKLESNLVAAPDWRAKARSVLAAPGETFIILYYDWGTFSISCTDSTIHMRRTGEDRRLMRQGVGMYVRRHFRTALEKEGWEVANEGSMVLVTREDGTDGSFRSTKNKFLEQGTLKLSEGKKLQLAHLASVFLDEIREDPVRLSADLRSSLHAVTKTARVLDVADKYCFTYGTLGTNTGLVADGRVPELMRAMSTIGSDGDFIEYPQLRWEDPDLGIEGRIFLELHAGKWTVIVSLSEDLGMSAPKALSAIVARFESAAG